MTLIIVDYATGVTFDHPKIIALVSSCSRREMAIKALGYMYCFGAGGVGSL